MKEKLITIVVLPYSKAHIFKMLLEAKKIECELEEVHLIEGARPSTVRVKILEKDIQKAVPELEDFLGKKPDLSEIQEQKTERQILIPVDFSEVSEKAGMLAFNLASHLKANLVFMHCYINPIIHSIPYSDVYAYDSSALYKIDQAEKNANEKFKKFMTNLADKIGKERWESVNTEMIIKAGYADEDILAYSRKHLPRLIVMGSGGDNHLHKTVGSVTADVMYNAPVPVLVVPEEMPEKEISGFTNVLYATDFDEKDFVALDKLMSLLKPFDMTITCVHVGQPKGDEWDLARLEGMKDILHKKYENKKFGCKLIVGSDILQSLENYIEHEKVDLLSLTTHKRNMISRLFNPSLSKKMVFHTHTPLLVFHA
ncbi:MAG: universal stress protein [Bacteroidota bacterium]